MDNDLEFIIHEHYGAESLFEIQNELEKLSLSVSVKERADGGPFAALDWIIPTGISLVVLKPYFETFLTKAAEDHYEMLKKFLMDKLFKKAITPDEEFKIVYMDGTEKQTIFTMHFSVLYKITKDGKSITLKLMFPKGCTQDYFERSIIRFLQSQAELEDSAKSDVLFDKLVKADRGMLGTKILWYNESKQALEFLDIVESSKAKNLIPMKLE